MSLSPESDIEKPLRSIPGSYGLPFFSAVSDRLDFWYNQGQYKYFASRVAKLNSTVIRTNSIPGPFVADPRMIALCDAKSFPVLHDQSKVLKYSMLLGNFTPSLSFTGGYRVCAYLDPSEHNHTLIKQACMASTNSATLLEFIFFTLSYLLISLNTCIQVYLDMQLARKSHFIPTFIASFDSLFDELEAKLGESGHKAGFNTPFEETVFSFTCEALYGSKPSPDIFKAMQKYIFLQFHPNLKLGRLPKLIEDFFLHTFPFPPFIAKSNTKVLYEYFSKAASWVIDEAEKAGMSRDEACHNIIFASIANAFLGFRAYLSRLFKWVVAAGPELHHKLASEIRSVLASEGGEVTASALEKMELTKSTAYEAFRIDPPVPVQFARAKKDFIVESHDAKYEVKEGELLGGFQPMATRDPKVFERAKEFVPDRFVGDGKKLLKYVLWANGPETESPTAKDKICPGKDLGVLVGRLLLLVLFRRYDEVDGEVSMAMEDVSVTITELKKAVAGSD